MALPNAYEEFQRKYLTVWQAYDRLGAAAHAAGPLDEKTRALVKSRPDAAAATVPGRRAETTPAGFVRYGGRS